MKGQQDTDRCASAVAAPIAFNVGDIRIADVSGNSTPWSGYLGTTFSSHVKQTAVHDAQAAARDGVNALLNPTGDAEVGMRTLCSL